MPTGRPASFRRAALYVRLVAFSTATARSASGKASPWNDYRKAGAVCADLEERFGLVFHREHREGSVTALLVAKGGLKVKPAAPESAQPAWVAAAAAVGGPSGNGNIGGIRFRSIVVPSVVPNALPNSGGGPMSVWESPSMGFVRRSNTGGLRGIIHYEAPSITFEGLADLAVIAGNGLDPAVVDMTGLTGRYQVNLNTSIADLIAFLTSPGPKDPASMQDAQFGPRFDT